MTNVDARAFQERKCPVDPECPYTFTMAQGLSLHLRHSHPEKTFQELRAEGLIPTSWTS